MQSETITVHANYEDIRLPSERLRIMLSNRHVPEEIIDNCELALHELLTNLVDHAYQGDGGNMLTVVISWDGVTVRIETRDNGKPADIDFSGVSMPKPDELAEGGYGVAIIKTLMDKVTYRSEQGVNIWTLIKHTQTKEKKDAS